MQRRQFLRTIAAAGYEACISSPMLNRLAAAQTPNPLCGTQQHGYLALSYKAPEWLWLWLLADVGFKDPAMGLMRQQYVPVSEVEVSLSVSSGRKAKAVYLMRANRSLPYKLEAGYAIISLPTLDIAEVTQLELTSNNN